MAKQLTAISNNQTWVQLGPRLEKTLGSAASLVLLCLMAITCADVVGRYFFDAPLAGAFEVTEILLAALVFSALPLTTERREHVEADILGTLINPSINRMFTIFGGLFSFALLTTFSWRLFIHANQAAADGTTTNALAVPLYPIIYFAGFCTLVSALVALLRGFQPPIDTTSS